MQNNNEKPESNLVEPNVKDQAPEERRLPASACSASPVLFDSIDYCWNCKQGVALEGHLECDHDFVQDTSSPHRDYLPLKPSDATSLPRFVYDTTMPQPAYTRPGMGFQPGDEIHSREGWVFRFTGDERGSEGDCKANVKDQAPRAVDDPSKEDAPERLPASTCSHFCSFWDTHIPIIVALPILMILGTFAWLSSATLVESRKSSHHILNLYQKIDKLETRISLPLPILTEDHQPSNAPENHN